MGVKKKIGKQISFFLLVVFLFLPACASLTKAPVSSITTVYIPKKQELSQPFVPHFVVHGFNKIHNRIGLPAARYSRPDKTEEEIFIDTTKPTLFFQERFFSTPKGQYINHIYRIHFDRVPASLIPFYLTAGENVGLFVIVTLNSYNQPVLVTTVHTCGCYLTFTPTSFMPSDSYPENWSVKPHDRWGEKIPGHLPVPAEKDNESKLFVFLRDGSHRVMDIQVLTMDEINPSYNLLPAEIAPLSYLKAIPLEGGSVTSFYDSGFFRKGYVKGSYKPWEMALISWWAFDLFVGCDKEYGDPQETGNIFYTSLQPWYRKKSDMWDYAGFLTFWGWNL